MPNGLLPCTMVMSDKPRYVRSLSQGTSIGPGDPQSLPWPCHSPGDAGMRLSTGDSVVSGLIPNNTQFLDSGIHEGNSRSPRHDRAAHDFSANTLQQTPLREPQLANSASQCAESRRWWNAWIS